MKNIITIILITIIASIISCQNKPSSEVTTYKVGIVERDSLYYFQGSFFGHDTITLASFDGFVIHPEEWLVAYNNSIIRVSGNQIIPQKVGTTNIVFRFSQGETDSFKIEVNKINGKLVPKRLLPNQQLKLLCKKSIVF